MIAIEPAEPAEPADRAVIESLLSDNCLPTAGLEPALSTALVAREDGRVVGCAAVEPYGSAGLLRSVCVAASCRGVGLARRLVRQAEAIARARGIGELFLLTESATEWFPRLVYSPDDRLAVPLDIQASPEFTGACPESAMLLRKRLESVPAG